MQGFIIVDKATDEIYTGTTSKGFVPKDKLRSFKIYSKLHDAKSSVVFESPMISNINGKPIRRNPVIIEVNLMGIKQVF